MPALIDLYDYEGWLAHRIAVEIQEVSTPHRTPDVAERRLDAFRAAAERVASGDIVGLVGVAYVHMRALTADERNALLVAAHTVLHATKQRGDYFNTTSIRSALGGPNIGEYPCDATTAALILGGVRIARRSVDGEAADVQAETGATL